MPVPEHTRLRGYTQGHIGGVQIIQPAAVLPETGAQYLSHNPQYVCSAQFDSRKLWGAGAEPFALTVEPHESNLQTTSHPGGPAHGCRPWAFDVARAHWEAHYAGSLLLARRPIDAPWPCARWTRSPRPAAREQVRSWR
ncbi:SH3-like domain-containing protein [Streptomyces mirabilis]|uniref:SH3-like domain-containing protein n=1 Tax=Streptomyces mirabilis TaxID=68239 RepID=UPI00368E2EF0